MRKPFRLLAVMCIGSVLTACASSPPSTFYTLTGTSSSAGAPTAAPLFIEMLPVSVPERLARPQIVLRSGNTQLDIREQDRWASPFNAELRDALSAGIAAKTGGTDITKSGRPLAGKTYRIAVDLQQFDAVAGKEVRTVFGWTVTGIDGGKSVVCKVAVNEQVSQPGVEGIVASVQRVVDRVATTIAGNIVELNKQQIASCNQ